MTYIFKTPITFMNFIIRTLCNLMPSCNFRKITKNYMWCEEPSLIRKKGMILHTLGYA